MYGTHSRVLLLLYLSRDTRYICSTRGISDGRYLGIISRVSRVVLVGRNVISGDGNWEIENGTRLSSYLMLSVLIKNNTNFNGNVPSVLKGAQFFFFVCCIQFLWQKESPCISIHVLVPIKCKLKLYIY